MTRPSHTPGPWFFGEESAYGRDIHAGDRWIASAVGPHSDPFATSEECIANARLIVAAPDMLAVLENISTNLEAGEVSASILARSVIAINAAIAKAKGVVA